MKAKKLLSIGIAALTAMSLVACGGSAGSSGKTGTQNVGSTAAASTAASDGNAVDGELLKQVTAVGVDPANTEKSDQTLTVVCQSEPSSMWCGGSGTMENEPNIIDNCIMDRLVTTNTDKTEIEPRLAKSWDWVDDTHIRFHLRDDVKMTDGSPLVADDVVYTVKTLAQYSANTDSGRYFDPATTVAEDDYTVTIGFNVANPDILFLLAWANFGIFSEDEVNALGGVEAAVKKPVMGAGPYKFVDWTQGQSVTVERNDDYWDPDYAGYYKTIKFVFTQDPASREMAVEAGDANVAMQMPVSQAATFVGNDAVQVKIYGYKQIEHLYYNLRNGACTDPKVREAIHRALDYDAIAQVATAGYSDVATGWFCDDSTYHTDTYAKDERKVDLEKAKGLLKEAGYENGLELTTIGTADGVPLNTTIQAQLAKIGIKLTINTEDTPQFIQDAFSGNYDFIYVGSDEYVRTPTAFTAFRKANLDHSVGGPKWTTDEIDGAIAEALAEKDQDKAKEQLAAIEQTFKDNFYVEDLFEDQYAIILSKNLKGLHTIERGWPDLPAFYEG